MAFKGETSQGQDPLFETTENLPVTAGVPIDPTDPIHQGYRSTDYEQAAATDRFIAETGGGKSKTATEPVPYPESKLQKAHKHRLASRPVESRYSDIGSDTQTILDSTPPDDEEPGHVAATAEEAQAAKDHYEKLMYGRQILRLFKDPTLDSKMRAAIFRKMQEEREQRKSA